MKYLKTYEDHFAGQDGDFEPTTQPKKGEMTIQYLEELLEWLYYTDSDNLEKYEKILGIEELIQKLLNRGKFVPGRLNYNPTWSKKLEKEVLTDEEKEIYKLTQKNIMYNDNKF